MRPLTLGLLALTALGASTRVGAEPSQASLLVRVVVTRQCTVSTGSTVQVTCTRDPGAAIHAAQDGRASQPVPLVTTSPGVASASVPLVTPETGTTIVTVQF